MITYRGIPLRRILQVWPNARTESAQYLIETTAGYATVLRAERLGADGGIDEIINTAKRFPGHILPEKST